jgi:hypothetical protein
MIRYPQLGVEDLALSREPMIYFDQAADPFASLPVNDEPIEPTPTVSDPTDWKLAAVMNEPVSEPIGSWESELKSEPVPTKIEPTIVLNKYEDHSSTAVVPVDLYPVDSYEVPKMKEPITCNCIDYPCDCEGTMTTQKIDLPLPYEPAPPIVDLPTTSPIKLPGDVPVQSYPPTINISVATQTPTTQQATGNGDAADDETAMIFGYPWYYAVGAAAAALFLMSSMDGKR